MFIIFCWSFQRIIRIKPAEDSHYNTFKILLLTPGRLEEEIFTGQKLNHKLLQETGPGSKPSIQRRAWDSIDSTVVKESRKHSLKRLSIHWFSLALGILLAQLQASQGHISFPKSW